MAAEGVDQPGGPKFATNGPQARMVQVIEPPPPAAVTLMMSGDGIGSSLGQVRGGMCELPPSSSVTWVAASAAVIRGSSAEGRLTE